MCGYTTTPAARARFCKTIMRDLALTSVSMSYQIDQSGKIERTNKDTVLCLSNGEWDAIVIKAKTKRQLQDIFRRYGQPRNFILFTFSALVAILLERNEKVPQVEIDREYYGKEAIIKNIVLEMVDSRRHSLEIYFGQIGKKAMAHHRAYAVATKKLQPSAVIGIDEILEKTKKTEVAKGLKKG
jgi:hypothetical protein